MIAPSLIEVVELVGSVYPKDRLTLSFLQNHQTHLCGTL